jgi:N-acetylated-alpha-linked acidic dipeptidase
LVYVNFGVPEDYEILKRLGIDVKGKIVIVRYGGAWRGLKAKLAQENGAVGCIIYSDPHEDGYFQGDVYPVGPTRPAQGVQRGSVMDMPVAPGDPLSPGWASEPGSKRLTLGDSKVLMKIPVLPVSYGDAKPLLEALGGPVAPERWRGALPITYHTGPGPATVHLKLDFDWTNKPLYDVIVTIPGSVYKDQWVVYGNHHDAWVNGASDPGSGSSVLLETARTLSQLRKQGWQPKRTLILALWDGEEFGLVGSTEWVEKHQDDVERRAAAYLNSDSNGRGRFEASGSNMLDTFVREVMRDNTAPGSERSVLETAMETKAAKRGPGRNERPDFRLNSLGSGSDYVAFLDHAGVASLNFGFGGADPAGVYHSIYDTVNWFEHFGDTDFSFGRALTQIMTVSLMRLADAPILPFDFTALAGAVQGFLDDVQKQATKTSHSLEVRDVKVQWGRLSTASKMYDDQLTALLRPGGALPLERWTKINELIARSERSLLLQDGLPGRVWYRHQVYAPGMNTGYSAKTLPGVREAVEAQHWEDANQQARRLALVLRLLATKVEDATKMMKEEVGSR